MYQIDGNKLTNNVIGIEVQSGDPTIKNNTIENNTNDGITVR